MRGDDAAGGSGLGLAIVQKIADRTAARLDLASPLESTSRGFRASIKLGRNA
jgi:nitrogen fixation/metabolism regulation signal transduction histidine kinase